jgi:hypothetical protein
VTFQLHPLDVRDVAVISDAYHVRLNTGSGLSTYLYAGRGRRSVQRRASSPLISLLSPGRELGST